MSVTEQYVNYIEARMDALGASNPLLNLDPPEIMDQAEDLMDQVRAPIIKDIEDQIDFLKEVTAGLYKGIKERSAERVDRLIERCIAAIEHRLEDDINCDDLELIQTTVREVLDSNISRDQIDVNDAKALRSSANDLVKMINQYRDFIKGIVINVEFDDEKFERLCKVIFRVIPPEYQLAIVEALKEFAPDMGQQHVIDI